MKKYIHIIGALLILASSCQVDDIKTFDMADSAIVFTSSSFQFSMKGVTEETISQNITLNLVGPIADYDRPINIKVNTNAENTAVEGQDFELKEAVLKAGEYKTKAEIIIKQLPEGIEKLNVSLSIIPNEYFRKGYPATSETLVIWSEEYVRPAKVAVWRYWFTFICKGYSKAYHELLIQLFGPDIERVTNSVGAAKADPELIYKMPAWWYGANAELTEYVRKYDEAHPGAPLMHSNDYERYAGYTVAVGNGTKPERTPTIYETIIPL